MSEKGSLHDSYGFQVDVYFLWCIAVATLIAGLSLPVITFTELIFKKSTYSILSGVEDLFRHNEYVLALVIFVFSVVFPIFKLLTLLYLWFVPSEKTNRISLVNKLGYLGKWSMLDVYVVAMTVVIAKSSALVKAEPQRGIYFFGASVILSIVVSMRIEHLSKKVLNRFTEALRDLRGNAPSGRDVSSR